MVLRHRSSNVNHTKTMESHVAVPKEAVENSAHKINN